MSADLRAPGDSHEIAEAIRDALLSGAAALDVLGRRAEADRSRYLARCTIGVEWVAPAPVVVEVVPVDVAELVRGLRHSPSTTEVVMLTGVPADEVAAQLTAAGMSRHGSVWREVAW